MPTKKGLWGPVVTGIVIAFVSGYASFLFGKSTIKSQVIREQRALAYVQLVDNRSLMGRIEESNDDYNEDEEYIKAKAFYHAARYRVLIFGGKEVVLSLAEYSYSTGDAFKKASRRLFQAMRHDLLSDSDRVSNSTIEQVLFYQEK